MIWLFLTPLSVNWEIKGEGLFRLLDHERPVYSRDGHFYVGKDGALHSPIGPALDPPVRVPKDTLSLQLGPEGEIYAVPSAGKEEIGRLSLARFISGQDYPIVGCPGTNGFGTVDAGRLADTKSIAESMARVVADHKTTTEPMARVADDNFAIVVPGNASVNGAEIRLQDIANVDDARIKTLSLGSSPLAGGTRTLTRDQVMTKLKAAGVDARLDMPPSITITRAAQDIPANRFIDAAKKAMAGVEGFDEKTFLPSTSGKTYRTPAGAIEITAGQPVKIGQGWAVSVQAVQDGKAAVSVPVRFQPAPAAATPIVHAVKVGDQVTVRCESGALVLDTIGIVRQAGAVGEQVNVTIVSTKKLIRAEVIDATTVRVIP